MFIKPSNSIRSVFDLRSDRLILSVLSPSAADKVTDYLARNRVFHEPFHQLHQDAYYTTYIQKQYLRSDMNAFFDKSQCGFWLIKQSDPDRIIGRLAFSGIIRGALQSCLMGYHLDKDEVGKGYMAEAIICACRYMFSTWKMHRIQADIMPRNERSIKTIERCGFVRSGLSGKYMAINGKWEDHYMYALINDNYFNPEIIR
ncbi:MAG: GNAT family N-acetyltransferase [Oscillospiraceae bacterium]|nr:GNAT family N-acetyltransferase [Clostridiales bacterium]MDD4094686.1 GNAT family N-acetyltransferase [Oscillospiraceae bacterium]